MNFGPYTTNVIEAIGVFWRGKWYAPIFFFKDPVAENMEFLAIVKRLET